MRKVKIVADSSANILTLEGCCFQAVPLKIITPQREFVDDAALDVDAMAEWFDSYKGKSKTSCPNTSNWLDAFGDAEEVYCVTITSGLSGSYNAACAAKQIYEAEHSNRHVYVIDSLSAGPELVLLIKKLAQYISEGLPFQQICQNIDRYRRQTGLVFILESLKNFAANGRVSPAVAKIAGVLGIRIVGKASDHGTLEPTNKCRGQAKSLETLVHNLQSSGLHSGKVRIAHCQNQSAAEELQAMILRVLPGAQVSIHPCRGLCSYYAEKGGLLVGFEKY